MGIHSEEDWSGIVVNGVTLGEPLVHPDGTFEWDGGVPEGEIQPDLKFQPAGVDGTGTKLPAVDMGQLSGLKITAWVQPEGAHDAYAEGAIVTKADGTYWKSITPANVWAPGVSGWRQLGTSATAVFPWVQPTGAHDAYKKGDRVTFNAKTYESLIDANVWSPSVYPAGWKVV